MPDTSGSTLPRQDDDQHRHTLTIHDVGAALAAAAVPRSERQIKRYCESGFLDAKKVPGPSGEQWYVAPAALPKLVGDLEQWKVQRAGQGRPQPVMSAPVTPQNPLHAIPDTPSHSQPQPDTTVVAPSDEMGRTQPVMPSHVLQLEKRIEDKDEVIGLLKGQLVAKDKQIDDLSTRFGNLSDRFADTQKLLGAMQRMFAPLLGQSDPYSHPADPAAGAPPSPSTVDNHNVTP